MSIPSELITRSRLAAKGPQRGHGPSEDGQETTLKGPTWPKVWPQRGHGPSRDHRHRMADAMRLFGYGSINLYDGCHSLKGAAGEK